MPGDGEMGAAPAPQRDRPRNLLQSKGKTAFCASRGPDASVGALYWGKHAPGK